MHLNKTHSGQSNRKQFTYHLLGSLVMHPMNCWFRLKKPFLFDMRSRVIFPKGYSQNPSSHLSSKVKGVKNFWQHTICLRFLEDLFNWMCGIPKPSQYYYIFKVFPIDTLFSVLNNPQFDFHFTVFFVNGSRVYSIYFPFT